LFFLLIHLYEYFKKRKPVKLKKNIWLRLTLGLAAIFLLMFTGFLLRGDNDTLQAREIFYSLSNDIPLIGNVIAYFILGKPDSFQVIYVNHIATFTIITIYIIFEHSKEMWPKANAFVISSVAVIVLSLTFSAPLHNGNNPTVKGPWYFVGVQDLLHWFSYPEWVLIMILLVLILVYLSGVRNRKIYFPARRALLITMVIYFMLTIDGFFFRGENWHTVFPWQKDYSYRVFGGFYLNGVDFKTEKYYADINGFSPDEPVESCLLCHKDVKGFTASHNPQATGCYSCHGGNPFSANKQIAHKKMYLIPGNLSNVSKTCGTAQCHPEITQRINTGLMANLRGMINVDRYVFDEQNTPDGKASISDLHNSAADVHLKNLCVRCHLGNDKTVQGPVTEESRGGGCIACHINYGEEAFEAYGAHLINKQDTSYLNFHPAVDLKVTNNHCFGCHSRSGRISTSYEGWHETLLSKDEIAGKEGYRVIEGYRVFRYVKEDVHHKAGLECIDCHTSFELMGDGNTYYHQEEQQDVGCEDCHTKTPNTVTLLKLDEESAIIAGLRFGDIGNKKFVVTAKHKKPLINVFVENDSVILIGKNSKKEHLIKPPAERCKHDKVHQDVSCSACHTSWAPTCIGCHNAYDPYEPGYDMVKNMEISGSWVEYTGNNFALAPTIGKRVNGNKTEFITAVPGMILSIDMKSFDKSSHDSLIFHRLYAPISAHTVSNVARTCKSCHNNSLALGYGKGELKYLNEDGKGKWIFEPEYAKNKYDGLPEDAWIPFLGERNGKVSTRSDVFPLSTEQQKKMLTVGACLTCHPENSDVIKNSLDDFKNVLSKKKSSCIMPNW
jgi:hypothetical protein